MAWANWPSPHKLPPSCKLQGNMVVEDLNEHRRESLLNDLAVGRLIQARYANTLWQQLLYPDLLVRLQVPGELGQGVCVWPLDWVRIESAVKTAGQDAVFSMMPPVPALNRLRVPAELRASSFGTVWRSKREGWDAPPEENDYGSADETYGSLTCAIYESDENFTNESVMGGFRLLKEGGLHPWHKFKRVPETVSVRLPSDQRQTCSERDGGTVVLAVYNEDRRNKRLLSCAGLVGQRCERAKKKSKAIPVKRSREELKKIFAVANETIYAHFSNTQESRSSTSYKKHRVSEEKEEPYWLPSEKIMGWHNTSTLTTPLCEECHTRYCTPACLFPIVSDACSLWWGSIVGLSKLVCEFLLWPVHYEPHRSLSTATMPIYHVVPIVETSSCILDWVPFLQFVADEDTAHWLVNCNLDSKLFGYILYFDEQGDSKLLTLSQLEARLKK